MMGLLINRGVVVGGAEGSGSRVAFFILYFTTRILLLSALAGVGGRWELMMRHTELGLHPGNAF